MISERVIKQTWCGRGYKKHKFHPLFYDTINGKLRRVSTAEGVKMIEQGLIPYTHHLYLYFQLNFIIVNKEPLPKL